MNRRLYASELVIPLHELLNKPYFKQEALHHGWSPVARVSPKRRLQFSTLALFGPNVTTDELFRDVKFQRLLLIAGYYPIYSYLGGGTTTSTTTTTTTTAAPICDKLAVISHTNVAAYNDFASTIGFRFTVGPEDITVTDLGRYKNPIDYLDITVNLYNSSNTLLRTTLVPLASATHGQFAYGSVTPLVLPAGQSYLVAAEEVVGGNQWQYQCPIVGNSDIIIDGSGGLAAGETVGSWSYGPVNFKYCI